jgi:Uncharacterized protein with a bacterial SH3 domain homologue
VENKNGLLKAFLIWLGLLGILVGCQGKAIEEQVAPIVNKVLDESSFIRYESNISPMKIMLPDDSWKAEEDSENLWMFASRHGIIMLSVTEDDAIVIPESAENIKSVLQKEGYNSEHYEVIEYSQQNIAALKSYRAVVKYDNSTASYAYGILYGTILDGKEYMASAMLYEDNQERLEQVKMAIYSFEVSLAEQLDLELIPEPEVEPEIESESTPELEPEIEPASTPELEPEIVPESTPEPTPELDPEPVIKRTKQSGNLRNGPGDDYNLIVTIPSGSEVLVHGQVNGWYEVDYNGSSGYIYRRFVD